MNMQEVVSTLADDYQLRATPVYESFDSERYQQRQHDEEHRRLCEARYVLDNMTLEQRRRYLERVEMKRGEQAALRLKADILEEWESRRYAA